MRVELHDMMDQRGGGGEETKSSSISPSHHDDSEDTNFVKYLEPSSGSSCNLPPSSCTTILISHVVSECSSHTLGFIFLYHLFDLRVDLIKISFISLNFNF